MRRWTGSPAPSHYLNQCWDLVNRSLRNKLQWNLNRNSYILIQENSYENVVWTYTMAVIISRPQSINQQHFVSGVNWLVILCMRNSSVCGKVPSIMIPCFGQPDSNQMYTALESSVTTIFEVNFIMTSPNVNIFRVTDPLCGEFTGHRWIPLTKASDAEHWCSLWSAPWINGWVNNCEACDLRRHRAHYDVIVMSHRIGKRWALNVTRRRCIKRFSMQTRRYYCRYGL